MPVKSGLILVVVGSGVQHPYIIIYIYIIPAPSNRCFLVTTGAQKPPVKVSKQPVAGSWYIYI